MGIKNNVFGLEQVYRLQVEGDWVDKNEVFMPSDSTSYSVSPWNYGYWIGGAHSSVAERLDFSNDTAPFQTRMYLLQANLSPSNSNYQNQSVASPSTAYLWLGSSSIYQVQAFEFANDTANLLPGLTPATFSNDGTTVYNANYGYMSGTPGGATIVRIDFSNESITSVNTAHSPGEMGATGNASYAWWGGGSSISSVSRMDYASDTTALAPKGPLAVGRGSFGGATGNADYGWFEGGGPGFTSGTTNVDRIDYSNDTVTASVRGQLIQNAASRSGDACGNSTASYLKNYFNNNAVQKIQYSNDTVTATAVQSYDNDYWSTSLSIVQYGLPQVSVRVRGFAPTTYGSATGYFGGGYVSYSSVDRIDYSNDTATAVAKGPLSFARYSLGATGNSFFGYFGGGAEPGTPQSIVDRIDYSNDTATASPKGPLSLARRNVTATGNSSYGYFGGGNNPPVSTVDRIDYSNDTATASVRGSLSLARRGATATGNASYGYFGGGDSPGAVSTVDRIDYSNDTGTAAPKGPLSSARYNLAATGNASFGYFGGGIPGAVSSVDRIDYSNDTATASPKGPLSLDIYSLGATGNQSFGYFGGGDPGTKSTVDRIDYSNDTATASVKGPLSQGRYGLAASSSHANGLPNVGRPVARRFNFATGVPEPVNSAYIAGAPGNSIHRYDYTNDTTNLISATTIGFPALSAGRNQYASSSTHGYWNGGNSPQNSYVVRLDYAAEDINLVTRASTPSVIYNAGSSYNLSYAWWGGGSAPSRSSNVTRLDYANDTTTPAPKGPLSASKYRHAATGNQNYGYHGGGEASGSPSTLSSVDRIDYSNDTATATPKGPLSAARRYFGAASNADYGYFAGGDPSPYKSTVDRIDFANDTVVALVKSPLRRPSPASYQVSAFGSSDAAHVFGGQGNSSVVERLDYANETLTNKNTGVSFDNERAVSARQNGVPVPIQTLRSFENISVQAYPRNFVAYFGGGDSPGSIDIHKFNIFNDNITPNVSTLSTPRGAGGATGNTNFGYWLGGSTSVTSIDRLDYSSDTATALARGNLLNAPGNGAATGNADFAYFNPDLTTRTERISFASDTTSSAPKGTLLKTRVNSSGQFTGNQSFGYYAGGYNPSDSYMSSTDRIDYSNDTATALARGTLTNPKYFSAASANASFGYWTGGSGPAYPGAGSSIDRLDFSSDTTNMLNKGAIGVGPSPSDVNGRNRDGGTGNGSYGFFAAGNSNKGVAVLDYANDTAATRSTTSQMPHKEFSAGVSAAEKGLFPDTFGTLSPITATNFGYFIAGPSTGILRIDYSNDTATGRSGSPSSNIGNNGPVGASSQTYGYIAGGRPASNGPYHAIFRLDYQNDVYGLALRSQLYAGMYGSPGPGASVYNTNYGYWAGSWNLSGPLAPQMNSSAVNRLDFANDTADAIIRGSLAVGQESFSGSGNASSGWFIGGSNGRSIIQRMDYSSDTTWTIKSPLPENRSEHGSTGNASYAWIGGGSPSNSSVTKLDYGNDTSSPAPKGPLSRSIDRVSATGNISYGYFVDGGDTRVDRIDYSNDTATASPKGPLGGIPHPSYSNRGFSAAANALPQ